MKISEDMVRHVARLARLHLSQEEQRRMVADLSRIVDFVNQLQELSTDSVPPTTHPIDLNKPLRPDTAQVGLSTEDVLRNAPEVIGTGFGVPKVVE